MTAKNESNDSSAMQGATVHPVDANGRITLKEHQDAVLPKKVYLTQGLDPCIFMLQQPQWEELAGLLAKLPRFDPDADDLRRVLRAPCNETMRDDQRRLKLPESLRDWAGLEAGKSRALVLDLGSRFEIWEEERYRGYMSERTEKLKEVARAKWGDAPAREAEDEGQ